MKAQFTTYDQADQADLYIGNIIQTEGQKKNPKYRCERWSGVTGNFDGTASIDYHEYLEDFKTETGINFSIAGDAYLLSQAAEGAALIIQTTQDALTAANAISGDTVGQLKIIEETKEKLKTAIETFSP